MHEFRKNYPAKKIVYCRSEEFTNRMIKALLSKTMDAFRAEFRQADLLLIDDMEFIAGKESTQEEFYNTFNEIYHSGGSIILTSDRAPRELKTLEDRLRTRFEGGIIAEISSPEKSLRKDFITRDLQKSGIHLENEEIDYLVDCISDNFRQLSGALKSIHAYYDILGYISHIHLEKIVSCITNPDNRHLTPERIIKETATYFDIDDKQIRGLSRERRPSAARQIAMYLCRDLLSMTLTDIGKEFGNRDHATVSASIKKAQSNEQNDQQFTSSINDLRMNLKMA